jgi:endonuclease V-like protein UPF0215 family
MPIIVMAFKVPLPDDSQKNLLQTFDAKTKRFEIINENGEKINRVDKASDETQKNTVI